jgi:hypothetical protein
MPKRSTAGRTRPRGGPTTVHPDAAEFTPIRGQLARAFLANKASMGLGDATDEWILAHVDDVAAVLMALTEHAINIDDKAWLRRYVWWRALAYALSNDKPGPPLDG